MKKREIREMQERNLNDNIRDLKHYRIIREYKSLPNLLNELYQKYQGALAGMDNVSELVYADRFENLCLMNKLDPEEEWENIERQNEYNLP